MKEVKHSIQEWQKQWMQDEGWGCGREKDNQLKGLGLTAAAINNLMDKIGYEENNDVPQNS